MLQMQMMLAFAIVYEVKYFLLAILDNGLTRKKNATVAAAFAANTAAATPKMNQQQQNSLFNPNNIAHSIGWALFACIEIYCGACAARSDNVSSIQ